MTCETHHELTNWTQGEVILWTLLVLAYVIYKYFTRWSRSYEDLVSPELSVRGLKWLSSRRPLLIERIRHWPFPMIEIELGRPVSQVCGIGGEYTEVRVVKFADEHGDQYELWAKIEFEKFKLRRIRWSPAEGASVHPATLDLIRQEKP